MSDPSTYQPRACPLEFSQHRSRQTCLRSFTHQSSNTLRTLKSERALKRSGITAAFECGPSLLSTSNSWKLSLDGDACHTTNLLVVVEREHLLSLFDPDSDDNDDEPLVFLGLLVLRYMQAGDTILNTKWRFGRNSLRQSGRRLVRASQRKT
jgi:hypothetical protein